MIGSSRGFLIRSILFRMRKTGAVRVLHQVEDESIALARRLGRVDDQAEHVDFLDRLDRGIDHPHVHPVQRPVDAGRVEEDHLGVGIVPHAENPRPGRLRLVGDDGQLRADQPVQQRGLAGVGAADERDEAGLHGVAASASRPRSRRIRTLWMRRRSTSSTSTRQPVDVDALADRRHAAEVRQQVAADRLEPFPLDLDAEPLRHLVDVHLAVEHEPAAAFVDDRLGLDVVLVANLADDLLEQVLDRHEAGGAAVLVDDDGDLRLLPLELLQQLGHALALRDDHRRAQQRGDRPRVVGAARARPDPSRTRSPRCCRGSP